MTWTREDSKDVLRKALGTLIAAGLISVGTYLIAVLTPLILAIILFAAAFVIFIILWKAKGKESRVAEPISPGQLIEKERGLPQNQIQRTYPEDRITVDDRLQRAPVEAGRVPYEQKQIDEKRYEEETKLRKKALKTELKAKKKANKEKEKELK